MEKSTKRNIIKFILLILIPIIAFLFSITLGRYSISLKEIFTIIYAKIFDIKINYPKVIDTVIFQITAKIGRASCRERV